MSVGVLRVSDTDTLLRRVSWLHACIYLSFEFSLPVIFTEIRNFRDVGIWKMAQEEGALPVHVLHFTFDTLQPLACHCLLEPLLHAFPIMLFC